jgi:hypothetical protein
MGSRVLQLGLSALESIRLNIVMACNRKMFTSLGSANALNISAV